MTAPYHSLSRSAASHALQTYIAERTNLAFKIGDQVCDGVFHSGEVTQLDPERGLVAVRYRAWPGHDEPTRWDWFEASKLRKRT